MHPFYVEGLVIRKISPRGNRKNKSGQEVEPFGQIFWALTAVEALRMASESLDVQWVEGPTISERTEEQRMRQLGAPQLPGFEPPKSKPSNQRTRKG